MKAIKLALLSTALAFSLNVHADGHEGKKRLFGQVYSDCGIGAMIFAGENENERLLAMISNITFDLGTTAHLSNASSQENCTRNSHLVAAFIHQNIDQIESDLSRGTGDHLAAAISMLGCDTINATHATRKAIANSDATDRLSRSAVVYDTLNANCTA